MAKRGMVGNTSRSGGSSKKKGGLPASLPSKKQPKRSAAGDTSIMRGGSYSQSNKQRGMIARGRKALSSAMGVGK